MPFREDSANQRSSIKDVVVKYYNLRGLNVVLCDSPTENFNKYSAMNLIMQESKEEIVCIVNADAIVPYYFLQLAKEEVSKTNNVIKPFNAVVNIDIKNEKFISQIYDDDVVDDFRYIDSMPKFHHGTSWVMNKKSWELLGGFDESYNQSNLGDLDFSYMSATNCGLTYLDGLAYSFVHGKITPFWDIESQVKKIKTMQNFFHDSEIKIYTKSFDKINKMSEKESKELLDPDNYIKRYQLEYFLSNHPRSTKS